MYWLVKTVYLSFHLRSGYKQTKKNMKVDWRSQLEPMEWKHIYHLVILPTYKEPVELIRESLSSLTKSNYPQNKMIVVLALEGRAGDEHNEAVRQSLQNEFEKSFFRFHYDNVAHQSLCRDNP